MESVTKVAFIVVGTIPETCIGSGLNYNTQCIESNDRYTFLINWTNLNVLYDCNFDPKLNNVSIMI